MKLIVHATDGSPAAADALAVAINLARDTNAKLVCVSVHTVHPTAKGLAPPVTDVERPGGVEVLADAAAEVARAEGLDVEARTAAGDPASEIARLAEELGADLIVVGSRGFGAIHSALVGSVSLGLITRSKIPVTVVKAVHEPAPV